VSEEDVHVPTLLAHAKADDPPIENYRLGFLPGASLTEVRVTIAPVDATGKIGTADPKYDMVKLPFTPVLPSLAQFLQIPISWFSESGIYWVKISAKTQDSSPLTTDFYLVHEKARQQPAPKR
jgi:hypothetical protein